MRPPNQKIRRGQRWQSKKTGLQLEITGTQNGYYKTRDCYGSPKSHTIAGQVLVKCFKLVS